MSQKPAIDRAFEFSLAHKEVRENTVTPMCIYFVQLLADVMRSHDLDSKNVRIAFQEQVSGTLEVSIQYEIAAGWREEVYAERLDIPSLTEGLPIESKTWGELVNRVADTIDQRSLEIHDAITAQQRIANPRNAMDALFPRGNPEDSGLKETMTASEGAELVEAGFKERRFAVPRPDEAKAQESYREILNILEDEIQKGNDVFIEVSDTNAVSVIQREGVTDTIRGKALSNESPWELVAYIGEPREVKDRNSMTSGLIRDELTKALEADDVDHMRVVAKPSQDYVPADTLVYSHDYSEGPFDFEQVLYELHYISTGDGGDQLRMELLVRREDVHATELGYEFRIHAFVHKDDREDLHDDIGAGGAFDVFDSGFTGSAEAEEASEKLMKRIREASREAELAPYARILDDQLEISKNEVIVTASSGLRKGLTKHKATKKRSTIDLQLIENKDGSSFNPNDVAVLERAIERTLGKEEANGHVVVHIQPAKDKPGIFQAYLRSIHMDQNHLLARDDDIAMRGQWYLYTAEMLSNTGVVQGNNEALGKKYRNKAGNHLRRLWEFPSNIDTQDDREILLDEAGLGIVDDHGIRTEFFEGENDDLQQVVETLTHQFPFVFVDHGDNGKRVTLYAAAFQ